MGRNIDLNYLADDNFCLKMELDSINSLVNKEPVERWIPKYSFYVTDDQHMRRYEWVSKKITGKTVLDVACGAGGGTHAMAKSHPDCQVTGYDRDHDAVRYASHRFGRENNEFKFADAEKFYKENGHTFDTIVSFETIEHMNNPDSFLEQVLQALNDGGKFFVSTPVSPRKTNLKPYNQFHVIEWSFEDFHKYIEKYFKIDNIYLQTTENMDIPILFKAIRKFMPNRWRMKANEPRLYNSSMKKHLKKKEVYQVLECSKK